MHVGARRSRAPAVRTRRPRTLEPGNWRASRLAAPELLGANTLDLGFAKPCTAMNYCKDSALSHLRST